MARRKSAKNRSVVLILGSFLLLLAGVVFYKNPLLFPPCANSKSCINDLSGSYQSDKVSTFMNRAVSQPTFSPEEPVQKQVLGTSTEPKHIFVDLSQQRLTANEGNRVVFSFPISSGKWYPTPTGDFHIWIKLRNAHMEGGNPAIGTYYNLYNVPYTMFFANDSISRDRGFSLHGAYWHNNFGHPMSHGCVNIRPIDAKKLYDWADPPTQSLITYTSAKNQGTLVTIFGQPPHE